MNSSGGVKNMKKHASVYRVSLISLATAVVAIGVPWNVAAEDLALSNNAPAAVATPSAAPAASGGTQAPALAFGVSEVVKMYQGGIGKDVLVGYIENTVLPFHLNADGIIYLQHLGMPQEVTSALIKRDGELQRQADAAYQQQSLAYQQQQQATAAAPPNNQAGATAPSVVMPGTPPPAVSPYPDAGAPYAAAPPVAYPDYGVYPYYGYPYYYGPNVVIGGWGWGWGGYGWGGRGGFGRGGFGHGGFGGHSGHR
jgi:hypothetical protein